MRICHIQQIMLVKIIIIVTKKNGNKHIKEGDTEIMNVYLMKLFQSSPPAFSRSTLREPSPAEPWPSHRSRAPIRNRHLESPLWKCQRTSVVWDWRTTWYKEHTQTKDIMNWFGSFQQDWTKVLLKSPSYCHNTDNKPRLSIFQNFFIYEFTRLASS